MNNSYEKTEQRRSQYFAVILCTLIAVVFWKTPIQAAVEIDKPAGDVPLVEDKKAKNETKGEEVTEEGASEEDSEEDEDESWDSYTDAGAATSIAEEITDGVRIEDIIEPPSEYHYAAFGKQDPFIPPMVSLEDATGMEVPIVSPLQKYSLKVLKLVGVWRLRSGEMKAMIMTPKDNEAIIVRKNDPVGNRGGKILDVGKEYVSIREFHLSPNGTRQFEDKNMFLDGAEVDENQGKGKIIFSPGSQEPTVVWEGEKFDGDIVPAADIDELKEVEDKIEDTVEDAVEDAKK